MRSLSLGAASTLWAGLVLIWVAPAWAADVDDTDLEDDYEYEYEYDIDTVGTEAEAATEAGEEALEGADGAFEIDAEIEVEVEVTGVEPEADLEPTVAESRSGWQRAGEITLDVALVRPFGALGTAAGYGFYIAATPFMVLDGDLDDARDVYVGELARDTFKRPLGEF